VTVGHRGVHGGHELILDGVGRSGEAGGEIGRGGCAFGHGEMGIGMAARALMGGVVVYCVAVLVWVEMHFVYFGAKFVHCWSVCD